MRCGEVARILRRMGGGPETSAPVAASETALLETLVRMGHVESFTNGDGATAELERRRRELAEAIQPYPVGSALPEAVRSQVARAREAILTLTEREARVSGSIELHGRRYALTYRGRTLLTTLETRLERSESIELDVFEKELDTLRASFESKAERAKTIFDRLRGDLPGWDPSPLRAVAIGLASRREDPAAASLALLTAIRGLTEAGVDRNRVATLAECLVAGAVRPPEAMATSPRELVALAEWVRQATGEAAADPDPLTCAALLFPFGIDRRAALVQEAAALSQTLARDQALVLNSLAPHLLVAAAGAAAAPGTSPFLAQAIGSFVARGIPAKEAEMAAAVLATSGRPPPERLERFDLAWDYLSRLSPAGMAVPAAMIAVLRADVGESLDNLRLASATITARGLAPGGLEGLSLGLKLLMQTAILVSAPGGPPPEAGAEVLTPFGLLGLSLVAPAALVALAAFHEITVQRFVTSEYAYHPIHTHYIYG